MPWKKNQRSPRVRMGWKRLEKSERGSIWVCREDRGCGKSWSAFVERLVG